ncbi:MAG: tRNA (adenosine(37)-N6)-dimethylallyltransferase MiaA [Akkermansiaceae bacterium]|nr:tRNA (adenosine(37)-N6)-dimethylallyltransferase MiaA [Akkermansiaceae bacterium]
MTDRPDNDDFDSPAVFLAGPTGSGKSAVSIRLAQHLGRAEIVNADAFQIYRGLEILTAAPSLADREKVPHHLYGVLSPADSCDAARFAEMAEAVVSEIANRGAVPIVVGGGGLYLKALTHGLAPVPKGDPALRGALDRLSLDDLVSWLRVIDPAGAAATNLKNRRYVTRNLEISLLGGVPASVLKERFARAAPRILGFQLQRERTDLHARIDARVPEMIGDGVMAELKCLEASLLSETAAKAIGLREFHEVIRGRIALEEAIATVQQATRRYAKRQATWFRRETCLAPIAVAPDEAPDSVAARIAERIRALKNNP